MIGKKGGKNKDSSTLKDDDNIELLDGDTITGEKDDMPSIQFSDHVHHILRKSMALSVLMKLLRRKIGFNTISSKLFSLWKPSQPMKLMDLE